MAASASAETSLDVDEMELEDLEDLGEMKGDDFVTSGEDSSDNEDLFETMVDADMLGRDETAQKANTDPEARKKKEWQNCWGRCALLERQMKCG